MIPSFRSRRIPEVVWVPVLLTALALAVRLYRLGAESIWLDEATSLFIARMDIRGILAWTGVDVHPPLYYLLLHVWRVWGDSEAALRGLSTLAGVASVPLLYALGRALFDRRTAAASALVLALAPLHVWYSQQARMYTLLTFWLLLASFFLVRALRRGGGAWWAAYAVAMALGYYTHYYSSMGLVFHGLAVAAYAARNGPRYLVRWAGAVAGSAILFLPWLPTMWGQISSGGGGWVAEGGKPGLRAIADTFVAFTTGNAHHLLPVWGRRLMYVVALGLLGAAGLPWLRRSKTRASAPLPARLDRISSPPSPEGEKAERTGEGAAVPGVLFSALYFAAPLGLAWLVSQAKPMYAERYLLPFLPGFCLLLGLGLASLPARWLRFTAAGMLVALLALGLWDMAATPQNDDFRTAAAWVGAGEQQGDVAIYYPGWNVKPLEYYLPSAPPSITQFPVPIASDQVAGFILPGLAGYRRAWVVWSVGHYGDPNGNVEAFMDGRYRRLETRQFVGPIAVALYDLGKAP